MLTLARVVSLLQNCVYLHVAVAVWPQHDPYDLFTSP